jgi:predicted HTH transcriptional regulator
MSPGGPYGNQTISKITSGWSSLRNPSLAKMFKYLHLIDNWGTGLERSIRMCNELGIKVEVLNDGIGIRFNIYKPSYKPEEQINNQQQNHLSQELYDNLTEQERTIVNFIKEHGSIRRIVVEDILDVGNTRAKQIITSLIEKDIVISEGKGPSVKYKLK